MAGVRLAHSPGIAFRHLPPDSARSVGSVTYATEGMLSISSRLSTDAVSMHPPKGFGTDNTVEAT